MLDKEGEYAVDFEYL
jgi:hypothetical protein